VSEQEKLGRIALENGTYETRLTRKFGLRKPFERQDPRIVKAVIPGVVAEVRVSAGSEVRQGDTLMVLEAMKMLNRIQSPLDGTVKTVHAAAGEKVAKGQMLIEIA
jgi:biotin carboxyl carrier protein